MSDAIRRALYGKMAGDTTLVGLLGSPPEGFAKSIFYESAPEGAEFPFVIFDKLDGRPTYAMSSQPALETQTWLVKAVDRGGSADRAEAVSARLNVLLTDATLSISGGELLYLRRDGDIDYGEVGGGDKYKHSGSRFRLIFE